LPCASIGYGSMHRLTMEMLSDPDLCERLRAAGGWEPLGLPAVEFANPIRLEHADYGKLVKTLGIALDQRKPNGLLIGKMRSMRDRPVAGTMLELLTAQSEERGSAPAILAPGRSPLSYGALRFEVDRAGAALAAMGLGRGRRVALALADGPDTAVAILAAMTWATCAPLDPRLDLDACRELLASLRVEGLIAAEGGESPATEAARQLGLLLVRLSSRPLDAAGVFALCAESARAPVPRAPPAPDDIALVMHTSGTTSRHKVVPLTHAQLLWSAGAHPIDSSDRCLGVSPLFTRSGLGISLLAPLARGASTVITPGFDAARFVEWLDVFQPTFYSASPTVQASVLDALAEREPGLPHSLRFVRSSSSALPASTGDRLASAFRVPVIQGYGSTEAGSIAQNPLPPGEQRKGSAGIAHDIEVMIIGESANRLPGGETGEILVRGPGVMHGYENDPEANRLAFHDGWFRTGDLGFLDGDGYLFLTGRIKEQINRGGLKVSPNEVDELFMRHPAVREAATFGLPHPSLGEDVVTAIILREPGSITAQQVRDYALRHLAPFKAPSSVVFVNELPRNALGKVRRDALAESVGATLRADFVPPRSAGEELVAGIFAQLLDLPRIGAHDHFFHLGGDSLRAVQVLSRLSAQTGVEMDRLAVFEAPTVEELAERLANALDAARNDGPDAPPLLRRRHRSTGTPIASTADPLAPEE